MQLAENTAHKKSLSAHHCTNLSCYISATVAYIDNRKKLLSSNVSPRCHHNMMNFGTLAAEIDPDVWGTPTNFNGFRYRVTARYCSSGRQPNFAALNRGCQLYSAGRPSHWALAHILVLSIFFFPSPNLSRRRLDVCYACIHGVALVRV